MKTISLFLILMLSICSIALIGCNSGGDDDDNSGGGTGLVAGDWPNGFRTGSNAGITFSLSINQSGDSFTGSYSDSDGFVGNITGSLTGQAIEWTLNLTGPSGWQGGVWTFDGTVNGAGTSMSGAWRIIAGRGEGGPDGGWNSNR